MSANNSKTAKGLGHYCVEFLDRLALEHSFLNILETGTMFKLDLEPGETDLTARSTYAIAKWAQAGRPSRTSYFTSVDSDASHQNLAAAYLHLDKMYNVNFVTGKSADVLPNIPGSFEFVLLDSDSDADVICNEYLAIAERVSYNGIILIDDAFKHPSVNKFRRIRERLRPDDWYNIGGFAAAIRFGIEADRICREVAAL